MEIKIKPQRNPKVKTKNLKLKHKKIIHKFLFFYNCLHAQTSNSSCSTSLLENYVRSNPSTRQAIANFQGKRDTQDRVLHCMLFSKKQKYKV